MGHWKKRRSIPDLPRAVVVPPDWNPPMGVSVFCGWASPRKEYGAVPGVQCPSLWPWKAIQTKDRVPALGEYDERLPEVTQWRLEQMQRGKIDFVCYQIEWAHEHTQPSLMPTWRPPLESPLLNSHCADNHPPDSPVKFCVSLWDVSANDPLWNDMVAAGWTIKEAEESWRLFAREVATRYMSRPNYFTIDSRPVLFRGYAEAMQHYEIRFGLTPTRIVRIVREEIKSVTGKGLYLVATATDPPYRKNLKALGFDCLTEYLLHGDRWQGAMASYRDWWVRDLAQCEADGLDYIVPVTSGYDSRAWGNLGPPIHQPTAVQFREHLREARALARENAKTVRGVCAYAWSEFGEGGIIEPLQPGMLHNEDEMIVAHREACA